MLTLETATADLRDRCEKRWLDWVLARDTWPLRRQLKPPTGDDFTKNLIATQNWAATWHTAINEGRVPGSVTTTSRRAINLGDHDLPKVWTIDTPEEALTLTPGLQHQFHCAATRLNLAVTHPGIVWDDIKQVPYTSAKTIAKLDDSDWSNAVAVVSQLAAGPVEAMMVRQLAVPGVHSKWIEQHASLLGAMIGAPTDTELGDPLTRLIDHIGLKAKETPVHVALRCPRLRAATAELHRFDAPVSVLNASTIRPDVVLIVENDELGHTITADIDGAAIIHGLGSGAPILVDLEWLTTASTVLYWGDIDRAGLSILATLRRTGVPATAILMDEITLDRYAQLRHKTDSQTLSYSIPVGLTATETALYQRLNSHHHSTGTELQLEQEHIPIADAVTAIRSAIER